MPPAPPTNVAATMAATIAPPEITNCACSNGCARIDKATHYATLSIANSLRRDICCSRNNGIVVRQRVYSQSRCQAFHSPPLHWRVNSARPGGSRNSGARRLPPEDRSRLQRRRPLHEWCLADRPWQFFRLCISHRETAHPSVLTRHRSSANLFTVRGELLQVSDHV